ncbi:DUF3710 domain-containing protein [Rhodococcus kronopolitis]|uniref:DUF3710 domain-containing protein n=1 Tax=Rhodococcus kronopolitis TaxID=1460226 RepID=A0ABV9FND4_9NOCA
MFGRKKKDAQDAAEDRFEDLRDGVAAEFDVDAPTGTEDRGPYDLSDLDGAEPTEGAAGPRLDLGSVLLPMPAGGQIQVEMSPDGTPQAVHLVTAQGRITVAAYAAPKSAGQWREVAGDLAESLRADNATVSIESGPWGRELHAVTPAADLRFIGVDGYRWMIRCVVAGPAGSLALNSPLAESAREVLRDTVVQRGDDPHPVRTPLPVVLPQMLAEQLAAAQQQQLQAQHDQMHAQEQEQRQPTPPPAPAPAPEQVEALRQEPPARAPEERPGGGGSAMQQLGQ